MFIQKILLQNSADLDFIRYEQTDRSMIAKFKFVFLAVSGEQQDPAIKTVLVRDGIKMCTSGYLTKYIANQSVLNECRSLSSAFKLSNKYHYS